MASPEEQTALLNQLLDVVNQLRADEGGRSTVTPRPQGVASEAAQALGASIRDSVASLIRPAPEIVFPAADDPAAPGPGEISDTAGLEAGRILANLGATGAVADTPATALAFAGLPAARFDLSQAQNFLSACMNAHPRVGYGLGKKAPRLGAVPGRDFTQIDCSGFVREAVRRSTTPTLPFPDGSVVQHEWVRGHGFAASSITEGAKSDGVVRIAFLKPQDSGEGIGHVVLIADGKTLESHGHVGPDARDWTGQAWQSKAAVYVFARNGQVALPAAPAGIAAAAPAVFTVQRGHRYAADIVLSFLESLASNDQIASVLQHYGFADVVVTGSGWARHAEATWNAADASAPPDPHLRNIHEIPLAPAAAQAAFVAAVPQNVGVALRQGHRYAADIILNLFEAFASNDQIASMLTGYGFTGVVVTGDGGLRHAEGTWSGADVSGPSDPHLRNIHEIPVVAPPAGVAAPAIVASAPHVASVPGPSRVFQTAGLPKFHRGMLEVRIRGANEPSRAPMAPLGIRAAAGFGVAPQETDGLQALSFYSRAGKIVAITPLRAPVNLTGPTPTAAALMSFAPLLAAPAEAGDDVRFIEVRDDADVGPLQTALAGDPNVAEVSRVAARYLLSRRPSAEPAAAAAAAPQTDQLLWNMQKILWAQAHGLGEFRDADEIKVAVLDTGVDPRHPNLQVEEYHWSHPDILDNVSDRDIVGHGTHVCGIVSALLQAMSAVRGVCKCKLIVHKIFTDATALQPVLGGSYWAYTVDPKLYARALANCVENAVDVVNLSIGGPQPPGPNEANLFKLLGDAGAVVCAAMGNERQSQSPPSYPAKIDGVIAVGATNVDDKIAYFSSRGEHIALCAPGDGIFSTRPTYGGQAGFYAAVGPDGATQRGGKIPREVNFGYESGTSMAAPHVTGAVALLLAKIKAAGGKTTPAQVKQALMDCADKTPDMNGDNLTLDFGAGRLNLLRLLQ